MTKAYQPVAGCIERCKSGSEWEGWEVIPSSTPPCPTSTTDPDEKAFGL
ncbi:MAG: hypothetical protein GDA56_03680 [Hormoscilla sp. GM7CHS1pb]|nr:hypothetical protein [Hormoscilla sp. GM7CHS1pb]